MPPKKAVKKKAKRRPPRIRKNKRGYYYIVNGRRKYIKVPKDITERQVFNINIKNVLGYKPIQKKRKKKKKLIKKPVSISDVPSDLQASMGQPRPDDFLRKNMRNAPSILDNVEGRLKKVDKGLVDKLKGLDKLLNLIEDKEKDSQKKLLDEYQKLLEDKNRRTIAENNKATAKIEEISIDGQTRLEGLSDFTSTTSGGIKIRARAKKEIDELSVKLNELMDRTKNIKNSGEFKEDEMKEEIEEMINKTTRKLEDDAKTIAGELDLPFREEVFVKEEAKRPFKQSKKMIKNATRTNIQRFIARDPFYRELELPEKVRGFGFDKWEQILEYARTRSREREDESESKEIKQPDLTALNERFTEWVNSEDKTKEWNAFRKELVGVLNEEEDFILQRQRGRGEGFKQRDRGLWNDEIHTILKDRLPEENIPVIANNEIVKLAPMISKDTDKFGFVVNTDDADESGRHWKSVFISKPDASVEVYDSLVSIPNKKFLRDVKYLVEKMDDDDIMYKVKVNLVKDQDDSSPNCGFFAIKFLEDRFKGKPFKDATLFSKIDKSGLGEKTIKKYKTYL